MDIEVACVIKITPDINSHFIFKKTLILKIKNGEARLFYHFLGGVDILVNFFVLTRCGRCYEKRVYVFLFQIAKQAVNAFFNNLSIFIEWERFIR